MSQFVPVQGLRRDEKPNEVAFVPTLHSDHSQTGFNAMHRHTPTSRVGGARG